MQNQVVDRLTLENLIPTMSLESLTKGYILNCKPKGKSPKTIAIYETVLRNFNWYCQQNKFPEAQQLTAVHICHFLWYLSTEFNRWGNNNPATRKPASQSTVSVYYRSLRTFFNWLTTEHLIPNNPMDNLKKPKPEKKVIQALSTNEIDRLFKECSRNNALDIRNKGPNQRRQWNQEDNKRLKLYCWKGMKHEEIANELRRSVASITARIQAKRSN